MGYPEHPDTIIIKNKYYPRGMREIDVWNYYQSVKRDLLKETFNRDLLFFIMANVNKPIVRRRAGSGYIRLTPKNYDTIITGRSISIHSAMKNIETFGIIDIDIDPSDGFKWARKVTKDTYDFVMDKIPIIRTAQIRFTGKDSFHIICDLGRRAKIDSIRFLLRKFLSESELAKVYTVSGKRTRGVPNLDLAPNKFRGNYITLHSLSVLGLKCMEVPYTKLLRFDQTDARIRI
ncbi:MAG: hypothetical protein PVG65_03195 [Candidatus Thorarchaeota archaeon]|jgi:hypothetical protein